jgi:hypothetical protein
MNKIFQNKILRIVILLFAVIGFFFTFVFIAMQFGWLNVRGTAKERNSYFNFKAIANGNIYRTIDPSITIINSPWINSSEWQVMKTVFARDKDIINKAANDAGISPRILLGGIIGEQFRFFTKSRESFKQYFEPLKILASLSKFSFGIAGLKPYTVGVIDEHLKDKNSPFYLGEEMENVITYPEGVDHETERFNRITDVKNPYYSYLYVGLYMRQVAKQWENAGYPIDNRPEIFSTLYNLGFPRSIPKANPKVGGAPITINGQEYSFGELGYEFYYSNELIDEFPK